MSYKFPFFEGNFWNDEYAVGYMDFHVMSFLLHACRIWLHVDLVDSIGDKKNSLHSFWIMVRDD